MGRIFGVAVRARRFASVICAAVSLSAVLSTVANAVAYTPVTALAWLTPNKHPIGVVDQPGVALGCGGCRVGELHVAVCGDRAKAADDVGAELVGRPVFQHLPTGLQQVDDGLLLVPSD